MCTTQRRPTASANWPALPRSAPTWRDWPRGARPTNQPAQYQPSGEFTGNIRFAQQAGRITGELTATGQNLSLASRRAAPPSTQRAGAAARRPATKPSGKNRSLTLRGATNYDAATDRLSFDQFQIQSNTLQANAAGQIERLSTAAECNVNGTLNYDLAQVTPLLRPYLGEGIQLTGREQARFALAGKLSGRQRPAGPAHQRSDQRSVPIRKSEIRNPKPTGRAASVRSSNCRGAARMSTACPSAPAARGHAGRWRASNRADRARRRRRSAEPRAECALRSRAGRAHDAGRPGHHQRAHLARSQRGDAQVRRAGARRRDAERRPVLAAARRPARAARPTRRRPIPPAS